MSTNKKRNDNVDEDEELTDGRGGIRFGTGIAYDDAYGSATATDEYVTELPTPDEERKLWEDQDNDDSVRARERAELDDEGRVGGMHPSSAASIRVCSFMSCFDETFFFLNE